MGRINNVSFPSLGLDFTFSETITIPFTKIEIFWYAIIIATGMTVAGLIGWREYKKAGKTGDDLCDFLLFALPLGILGARLYYVIFRWDLYKDNLSEIFAIWNGGLAIYGGIIAGAIVAIIYTRVKKYPFLWFADVASFGLFIAQSMGRWGNFINAEAYGGPTDLPWGMVVNGVGPVHPTFLYESLWNITGFLVSYFIIRRVKKTDGLCFAYYLIWYGIGRFFIEGLRSDSLYLFGDVRVSQVVAFISVLLGIFALIYVKFIKKEQISEGNVTV